MCVSPELLTLYNVSTTKKFYFLFASSENDTDDRPDFWHLWGPVPKGSLWEGSSVEHKRCTWSFSQTATSNQANICMYYMSMLACADMYNHCPEILKGHRTAAVHRKKIWTSCCVHCNFSQVSIPEELQFTLACMDLSPYSGQKKKLCCHCLVVHGN